MNKKLFFLLFALIFCGNWAFNQVYFQTISHQLDTDSTQYHYQFLEVPTQGNLLYNPKLRIRVRGDFNTASKGFSLYDQDDNLIHTFNNLGERCKDSLFEYTMTSAEFQSYVDAEDTLELKVKLTNAVDAEFCDKNYIYISLEVNFCNVATQDYLTPTITFPQTSYCSGAGNVNFTLWPIGGILSGEGVIQNGLNFAISTENLQADTTYEYIYKQYNNDGCQFIGRNSITIKKSPENLNLIVCAGNTISVNTPAKWYDDAQRLHQIGNGTEITPVHTAGTQTYYLNNYQFQSSVTLDTLTLKTSDNVILKDATTDNAAPAGGFAITSNYLYLGTSDTTVVYNANTLAVVRKVKKRNAFFSDLATGKLFTFYNTTLGETPNNTDFTNGIFDAIAELDANLNMTGIIHTLGKDIRFDEASCVASGFGEVFFSNSQNQSYIFELSTFTIRDFFAHSVMPNGGTNIFSYGFLLRSNGNKNVYFAKGVNTITKTNVENMNTTVVGTFVDSITAVTNIAFSPWSLRWYLSNSTNDELSNFSRVVASAKAILPNGIVYDTLDNCVSEAVVNIPTLDLGENIEVCEGAMPYTFTAPDYYTTYAWNSNETGENTYVFNQAGNVTLKVTDTSGCVLEDVLGLSVIECLAVNEIQDETIKMYPNPTTGILTIELTNENQNSSASISDINGRLIQTTRLTKAINTLDFTRFVSGIYFVSIVGNDGKTTVEKVIRR